MDEAAREALERLRATGAVVVPSRLAHAGVGWLGNGNVHVPTDLADAVTATARRFNDTCSTTRKLALRASGRHARCTENQPRN